MHLELFGKNFLPIVILLFMVLHNFLVLTILRSILLQTQDYNLLSNTDGGYSFDYTDPEGLMGSTLEEFLEAA